MKKTSEFGKGLTYCLGLFLAHAERNWGKKEEYEKNNIDRMLIDDLSWMWFNGASDHLYELNYDNIKDEKLIKRLSVFQNKCLEWGHGFKLDKPKESDVGWAIQEAKDLLLEIDKYFNIKVIKGDYE